ncbi:hypothetical protein Pelo_12059 [Pelomyxa schiedti]|nr:hypothetical protein Pelo_12059 [Pelomyxa schiedti]
MSAPPPPAPAPANNKGRSATVSRLIRFAGTEGGVKVCREILLSPAADAQLWDAWAAAVVRANNNNWPHWSPMGDLIGEASALERNSWVLLMLKYAPHCAALKKIVTESSEDSDLFLTIANCPTLSPTQITDLASSMHPDLSLPGVLEAYTKIFAKSGKIMKLVYPKFSPEMKAKYNKEILESLIKSQLHNEDTDFVVQVLQSQTYTQDDIRQILMNLSKGPSLDQLLPFASPETIGQCAESVILHIRQAPGYAEGLEAFLRRVPDLATFLSARTRTQIMHFALDHTMIPSMHQLLHHPMALDTSCVCGGPIELHEQLNALLSGYVAQKSMQDINYILVSTLDGKLLGDKQFSDGPHHNISFPSLEALQSFSKFVRMTPPNKVTSPEAHLFAAIGNALTLHIMGNLDVKSLLSVRLVSKTWNEFFISHEQQIFSRLCAESNLPLITENYVQQFKAFFANSNSKNAPSPALNVGVGLLMYHPTKVSSHSATFSSDNRGDHIAVAANEHFLVVVSTSTFAGAITRPVEFLEQIHTSSLPGLVPYRS